ncbi:MAG TPA: hemerythrin family protein [Verrucomicrobiae bacterium]|nr:hemerythrin family protein [Verrucomicrobiae bacterium]
MSIEWRDYLSVDVEQIDSQHKELFRRFNNLLDACDAGAGEEELLGMLQFLDEYVSTHFRDEEKLQEELGVPGLEQHREAHRAFIRDLKEIKRRFAQEGSTHQLVAATNRILVRWLLEHIATVDRQIGNHVKQVWRR